MRQIVLLVCGIAFGLFLGWYNAELHAAFGEYEISIKDPIRAFQILGYNNNLGWACLLIGAAIIGCLLWNIYRFFKIIIRDDNHSKNLDLACLCCIYITDAALLIWLFPIYWMFILAAFATILLASLFQFSGN